MSQYKAQETKRCTFPVAASSVGASASVAGASIVGAAECGLVCTACCFGAAAAAAAVAFKAVAFASFPNMSTCSRFCCSLQHQFNQAPGLRLAVSSAIYRQWADNVPQHTVSMP